MLFIIYKFKKIIIVIRCVNILITIVFHFFTKNCANEKFLRFRLVLLTNTQELKKCTHR